MIETLYYEPDETMFGFHRRVMAKDFKAGVGLLVKIRGDSDGVKRHGHPAWMSPSPRLLSPRGLSI